jgi:hypothetical protein
VVAPVARVDPDQIAAECRDLFFGCWVLRHSPIVAGSIAGRHPGWCCWVVGPAWLSAWA